MSLPNTGFLLFYPWFVLTRPSGTVEPLLLQLDLPIMEDPLQPDAAIDVLLEAATE